MFKMDVMKVLNIEQRSKRTLWNKGHGQCSKMDITNFKRNIY